VAKWTYDDAILLGTSQKAVGLLIQESNGLSGTGQFSRSYGYDAFARAINVTTNLDGTNYYQRSTYDQFGRVFQSWLSESIRSARGKSGQWQKLLLRC
jgi:hypothetical protein